MSPRDRTPVRAGFTLIEAVVALSIGALVFGAFAIVVARQERVRSDLARRVRGTAQLQEGIAALAADLRGISPTQGDISPAGALDSAIEFRSPVGSGVACVVQGRTLVTGLASFVTPPRVGDTVWAYAGRVAPTPWVPIPVDGVGFQVTASSCAFPVSARELTAGASRAGARYTLTLTDTSATLATLLTPGTPVRVTRPVRYSLYHAPDGHWYLGRREWSIARGRFETVQPVSGPYRRYDPAGGDVSGLEIEYLDGDGLTLPNGSRTAEYIARVSLQLRAPPGRSGSPTHDRRDAARISIAFRNRS